VIRFPKHFAFAHPPVLTTVLRSIADSHQKRDRGKRLDSESRKVIEFPKRPDLTVLSETIPLFYIGQNRHGFWVAREAEGRCGGIFLLRQSAARFARRQSAPAGCAMMFVNTPFELDLENRGSRFIDPLAAAMDVVKRRLPALAGFAAMAVAEWRKLVAQVSRAMAGERRNRAAIERELFHGHYTLSSKNDDDLPIPD
jgi:hypothetical protein